jgi:cytochrome P450
LRKEVLTLDINHSPSFEQVESLKYLNNVCREVVRFIPPGPSYSSPFPLPPLPPVLKPPSLPDPLTISRGLVFQLLMTVAMTFRHTDKDDIVNGMKVPSGTSIFLASGVTNFDPDSWGPDVDSFNPDRWDNLPETISNYSFLTFLQGT